MVSAGENSRGGADRYVQMWATEGIPSYCPLRSLKLEERLGKNITWKHHISKTPATGHL